MSKVIAVEGLDLAGKTTLVNNLLSRLNPAGEKPTAVLYTERWGGLNGEYDDLRQAVIDPKYPKHIQRSIALGLRHELYLKHVIPALDQGLTVITDRSCISTAVYQSDLITSPTRILNENNLVSSNYRHSFIPDAVIYLEITHEEYLKRFKVKSGSVQGVDSIEKGLVNQQQFDKLSLNYFSALAAYQIGGGEIIRDRDIDAIITQLKL